MDVKNVIQFELQYCFDQCEKEVQPILLLKKSLTFSLDFYWHSTQVMHLQALSRPIH